MTTDRFLPADIRTSRSRACWRLAALSLFGLLAVACKDGTGVGTLGQLRIRPVFTDGQDPATLGVSVQSIHLVLRRDGGAGAVVVDTTLPYRPGSTTSWLLDLQNPPEQLGITGELAQGATTFYTGTAQASVNTGIGPSSSSSDLPMQYIGTYQSFEIDVTPDSAQVDAAGSTQQFAAEARGDDGAVLDGFAFTWNSSRPEVATVDPATGLATAVGVGRTIITASAGNVADSAVLVVHGTVVSLEVSPKLATVATNAVQPFLAVARDAQGAVVPAVAVTWTSENPAIATVNVGGVATGVATGWVKIIASAGNLVADTARLLVLGSDATVTVIPGLASIDAGATQQFTAVARDGHGHLIQGATFDWSSSTPVVATVDGSGLATGVSPGTATIAASVAGRSGTATLSVGHPGPGVPAAIVVSPPSATISALNGVQQFTAVALDAQGQVVPGVPFSWSSSNPGVATVDASGQATAQSTGTTSIIAQSGSLSGTASLSVTQTAAWITISPAISRIAEGAGVTFTAVAWDANGNVVPHAPFSWSTTDPSIAIVDAAGHVTGVSDGGVTVMVRSGSALATAFVTVAAIASIQVHPGDESLTDVGATTHYTAAAYDAAGQPLAGAAVTWSSSDPRIATIDPLSGVATALQPGTAQITATAGHVSASAWLVVQSPPGGAERPQPQP